MSKISYTSKVEICHGCKKRLLTNLVKVEIVYDSLRNGKYAYVNYYHRGCLLRVRSWARKISGLSDFDANNKNHIETLAWSYFKILFHGNSPQLSFDEFATAQIEITGIESELGFPVEMKLQERFNFQFNS
jgi:hypothetical protein